jgi:hypothetical protein
MTYPGTSANAFNIDDVPAYNAARQAQPEPATPPEPPVDVRIEAAISKLAHDFDLDYEEAAAIRDILHGDNAAAIWHLQLQEQKQAIIGRSA